MLKKGKKVWQALGFCAILLVLLVFVNWLFVPKNNTREAGIEDFLGNYLQKTGLLEDKRGNPAYASWDSCCWNFEDMAAKAAGNTGLEPLMEQ